MKKMPKVFLMSILSCSIYLVGCNDDSDGSSYQSPDQGAIQLPTAPTGVGRIDTAPVVANISAVVDDWHTNQRGDARYATLETNAGVRVLSGFLQLWKPSTMVVDAGVTAEAAHGFPAVEKSKWTGIPQDPTDGQILHSDMHQHNIQYVIDITRQRTAEQSVLAYLDDRRGKAYSMTSGLGALTEHWRDAAKQFTTITEVAADATQVKYDDQGNNRGVGEANGNAEFGKVVDFLGMFGTHASTEPAKRFYKYARPWRWSADVIVEPTLEPAKSKTPQTDGGFPSGHTAEGMRNAIAMAYVLPQRYQELIARGLEMGESRIYAGMHSPLDVMGGRIQSVAAAVANLNAMTKAQRTAAYQQAQQVLMQRAKVNTWDEFYTIAKQPLNGKDNFMDFKAMKETAHRRMTFGFKQYGPAGQVAHVPKGAEVLLESRFPYLTDEQRRVVLKSTAFDSGYPIMDDPEGYGRLDLFKAAGGYAHLAGDVHVHMQAELGGFSAKDLWNNDLTGHGKLTKSGSGQLALNGENTFTGGVYVKGGAVIAQSISALGQGDVYVQHGQLILDHKATTQVNGKLTLLEKGEMVFNHVRHGLQVNDVVTLQGKLMINDATLQAGRYVLMEAKQIQGKLSVVEVNGKAATVSYDNHQVILIVQ